MLFELDQIHRFYGKVHALDGVSLSLPGGSIGLLGPNGAGKSTLLKVALGLLPASQGTIRVLGFDPAQRSLDLRQRIGYMPESDCYIAELDAVETCTYGGRLCGLPPAEARERAHAVLEYVGLGDKRYMKVQTYSTGQKQRVKLGNSISRLKPMTRKQSRRSIISKTLMVVATACLISLPPDKALAVIPSMNSKA